MEKSLAELIELVGGEIQGDSQKIVRGIAPFDQAGSDDITFADSPKILKRISGTVAGAVIVPKKFQQEVSANLIKSDNPRLAFAKIMHACFPVARPVENISHQASVGQNVSFGTNVSVGPLAVIGDNVTIGSRVIFPDIGAYSMVKANWFNCINLPTLYALQDDGELREIRRFCFDDFLRMSGE